MGQAVAVPIILAVAAAGTQIYNQRRTARKQDAEAFRGLQKQRETQKAADARIQKTIADLSESSAEGPKETRGAQIRDQLRLKRAMALAGIQTTGGGDAVTEAAQKAGGTATDYGDFIGQSLAGIDAPSLQRQQEGFERLDMESMLNFLRRNSAQDDMLTRMRIQGIQNSPWLTMLSAGLSGASSAYSGGKTMAGSGVGATQNPMIAGTSSANMPFNSPDFSIFGKGPTGFGSYLKP